MRDRIKEYLAHCYLYYNCATSVINDHEFDSLCKELSDDWHKLESPWKQYLLDIVKGDQNTIDTIKGTELGKYVPKEIIRFAERLVENRRDEIEAVLGKGTEFQ